MDELFRVFGIKAEVFYSDEYGATDDNLPLDEAEPFAPEAILGKPAKKKKSKLKIALIIGWSIVVAIIIAVVAIVVSVMLSIRKSSTVVWYISDWPLLIVFAAILLLVMVLLICLTVNYIFYNKNRRDHENENKD